MLQKAPTETTPALERWLSRYGSPDAYQRWRGAIGSPKEPFHAFGSIAIEAEILTRVSPREAKALARAAEVMIVGVRASAGDVPGTRMTALAADVVQNRIIAWRRQTVASSGQGEWGEFRPPQPRDPAEGFTEEPLELTECWMLETLCAEFPHVRASCARYAFNTTLRMGVQGLIALGPPGDKVLAVAASRVAAQSALDHLPGPAIPVEKCLQVVQIVQDWALHSGEHPLALPSFGGPRTAALARVAERAVDTNACVALAARLPGGADAPGYAQWEYALENHAYVLMASRGYTAAELTFDEAREIGSAAARLAAYAMDNPACLLPALPEGWSATPNMVLKSVTSMIGDDLVPRRAPISAFRRRAAPADARVAVQARPASVPVSKPVFQMRPAWSGVAPRR